MYKMMHTMILYWLACTCEWLYVNWSNYYWLQQGSSTECNPSFGELIDLLDTANIIHQRRTDETGEILTEMVTYKYPHVQIHRLSHFLDTVKRLAAPTKLHQSERQNCLDHLLGITAPESGHLETRVDKVWTWTVVCVRSSLLVSLATCSTLSSRCT